MNFERLNNLPMPNSALTQISKVKEPASFCNFQNRKSRVVTNVRHFVAIVVAYSFFTKILENKSRPEQKIISRL